MTSNRPWWRRQDALARLMASLVEGELARLRPGRHAPAILFDADLVAGHDVDSLELMTLSTAIAETLQLQQASLLDGLLADSRIAHWTGVVAAALDQAQPGGLTFRTSGSAGTPKPCAHALATLQQEVAALAHLLPQRRRILSAVPAHHIYGFLFTVLLPEALGALPVIDVRARVAAGVLHEARPGDLVIGHPAWWQAALAGIGGGAGMAPDVTGVSSTAPCPDALACELAAHGLARLVQVYGSSETGGVGWRDSALAGYTLLPYWQRVAGDDDVLARSLPGGAVSLYRLQDRLAWQDDGHFTPAGRRDDAVQVGGVNVFPARVAEVLRQHPAVRDAAVRLMRLDEGTRLKAFVVGEGDMLATDLAAWAATRLSVAERPAAYSVGAALPRQRNGKLADWVIDA